MDYTDYLKIFKKAAAGLDKKLLGKKQIELEVGIWLDSVVLRLLKKSWANDPFAKPQSGASIFFSIWLNEASVKEEKIYYNIHALKLRELRGYAITSRDFATRFREKFKPFAGYWPHVSVDWGPLTLMQGWEKINAAHADKDILALANQFLAIDGLIDDLLTHYQQPK